MSRYLFFLIATPLILLGALVATEQQALSDDPQSATPVRWPSSNNAGPYGGGTVPTIVNLSIRKTASSDPATIGRPLTYTIVITNSGQNEADNVTVTDDLPANVILLWAAASQGTCSGTTQVTCSLGTVNGNDSTVTATIVVTPTSGISLSNRANVTTFDTVDIDESDNTATVETTLVPAPAPPDYQLYLPLISKALSP